MACPPSLRTHHHVLQTNSVCVREEKRREESRQRNQDDPTSVVIKTMYLRPKYEEVNHVGLSCGSAFVDENANKISLKAIRCPSYVTCRSSVV